MFSNPYNQQQPPPRGPPPLGGPPPIQPGGSWGNQPQPAPAGGPSTAPGYGDYNNQQQSQQPPQYNDSENGAQGGALTSAVDLVTSAASGLFFNKGKPTPAPPPPTKPEGTPPVVSASNNPYQTPAQQQRPHQAFGSQYQQPSLSAPYAAQPPIQPQGSMLAAGATTPSQPPPIEVTSSLLSSTTQQTNKQTTIWNAPPPQGSGPLASAMMSAPPHGGHAAAAAAAPFTPMTSKDTRVAPPMSASGPPHATPMVTSDVATNNAVPSATWHMTPSESRPNTSSKLGAGAFTNPTASAPPGVPASPTVPSARPPMTPATPTVVSASPVAARGEPPVAFSSPALKTNVETTSVPPVAVTATAPPPLTTSVSQSSTDQQPAKKSGALENSTPPSTPRSATGRPVAALSPRSSATKKLPLPPPSATLERRKKPNKSATKKFKLPPSYSSAKPPPKSAMTPSPQVSNGKKAAGAPPLMPVVSTNGPPSTIIKGSTPMVENVSIADSGSPDQQNPLTTKAAPPVESTTIVSVPEPVAAESVVPAKENHVESKVVPDTTSTFHAASNETAKVLPTGWQEISDPNTGQTYYWNESSNETCWERPFANEDENISADKPMSTVDKQTSAELAVETSMLPAPEVRDVAAEQPETTRFDSNSQLPEGWIEATNPTSGETYYVNTADNTTSWERPQMELSQEFFATQPRETTLPKQAPEESQLKETTIPTEAANISKTGDEARSFLPPGWVEVVDEASGRPYFFHEADNVTSWDPPAAPRVESITENYQPGETETEIMKEAASPENQATPQEVAPEFTQKIANGAEKLKSEVAEITLTADTVAEALDHLPQGWVECEDPTTGKPYYVNAAEHITTWERPVSEKNPPPAEDEKVAALDKRTEEEPSTETAPEVSGERQSAAMAPEVTENQEQEADNSGAENLNTGRVHKSDNQNLASEWSEVKDLSGSVYYYNEKTQETSWEKPVALLAEESNTTTEGENQVLDKEISPEMTRGAKLYNEANTDEPPEDEFLAVDGNDKTSGKDELPAGWMECFDANANMPYYYNASEDKTSWERPVALPSNSQPDHSTTMDEPEILQDKPSADLLDPVDEKAPEEVRELEEEVASPKLPPAENDAGEECLPPGWTAVDDPSTGSVFYFNEVEQTTTWDRPTAPKLNDGLDEMDSEDPSDSEIAPTPSPAPMPLPTTTKGRAPSDTPASSQIPVPSPSPAPIPFSTAEDQDNTIAIDEAYKSGEANIPPGWSMVVDPDSGKPYYVHETDGMTTWERPELDATREVAHEDYNKAETHTSGNTAAGETETGEERLPEERTTHVEEASGKPFVTNADDSTASREPPKTALATVETIDTDTDQLPVEGRIAARTAAAASSKNMTELEAELLESIQYDLPPGWIESVDPTTGNSYFYNENTGVTTWERPASSADAIIKPSACEQDSPELTDYHNEPESTPPAVVSSAPQPEGLMDNTVVEQTPERMDEDVSEPADLPEGWQQLVDPSSGLIYYIDDKGTTTWDPPIVLVNQESAIPTSTNPNDPQAFVEDKQDTTESAALPNKGTEDDSLKAPPGSDLPPGWIESIDESSGKPYYYNQINGESAWEKPTITGNADEAAPTPENIEQEVLADEDELVTEMLDSAEPENEPQDIYDEANPDEQREGATPKDESSNLPLGWTSAVDPVSGNTYYTNEVDGATSWDPPGPVVASIVDTMPPPVAPNNTLADENGKNESDTLNEETQIDPVEEEFAVQEPRTIAGSEQDLPPGWVASTDPSSGETYFFHEGDGISSWERPSWPRQEPEVVAPEEEGTTDSALVDTSEPPGEPADDVNEKSTENNNIVGDAMPPTDLSDGWVELVDESSGNTYYLNEADGTTCWERPTKELDAIDAAPPGDAGGIAEKSVGPSAKTTETPTTEKQAELPPGWVELVDPTSGHLYYLNEATNETLWKKPSLETATQADNAQVAEIAGQLQDGWEELIDQDGQVYYYNHTTGATQWERPVCAATRENALQQAAPATLRKPEKRQRLAHAFASFGFGGRLCIFRAGQALRPVEIHRVDQVAHKHEIIQEELSKQQAGINGPLNTAATEAVRSYIKSFTLKHEKDVLWRLIDVVSNSKGRIRSQHGVDNPRSPESAIVEVLLMDEMQSGEPKSGTTGSFVRAGPSVEQSAPVNGGSKSNAIDFIQEYVVRGKREEAIQLAFESNNFALALLIASHCGAETYQQVVQQYADKAFRNGSPLHTIGLLFSGQQLDVSLPTDSKELLESWRQHLAAIISNRITGWDRAVFSLGIRLRELGDIHAAHVCFLVAGVQMMSPIAPETCMSLLGCDHFLPENVSLLSKEGVDAYARTEAYEWAKRRGNPNALIKPLRPLKLQYAMLLADLGFVDLAKKYFENIVNDFPGRDVIMRAPSARLTVPEMCESIGAFMMALTSFEQRLYQTVPDSTAERRLDFGEPKQKEFYEPLLQENAPEEIHSSITPASPMAAGEMPDLMSAPSNESFETAATSQVPGATVSQPKNKIVKKLARINRKELNAISETPVAALQAPPKSEPPPAIKMQTQAHASAPMESDSPPAAAASAVTATYDKPTTTAPQSASKPSDKQEKKRPAEAPKSAPAAIQKKDWTFGMKDKMAKWLNPDATTADLGEGMQAYYDEDKKVWIFPGEDPAEVAKPPPPPPTTMASAPMEEERRKVPDMATDPLGALMAPVQRTPAMFGRGRPGSTPGGAGGAVPPTPRSLYTPGMPPQAGGGGGARAPVGAPTPLSMPPAAPGGGGAPPPFVVFQPSSAAAKIPEDEKAEDTTE